MSQSELLNYALGLLNANEIPYMVTGSVVSSLQGEPRLTHDIDIVIVLHSRFAYAFAEAFPTNVFYVNKESVKDAIVRQSMFNVIDSTSGNKVDFWILTQSEYDQVRFGRRQKVKVSGIEDFYVTRPEDTILSKLLWAKMAGGSQKQLIDATRVYELQYEKLDIKHIEEWVQKLELTAEWSALLSSADPI